MPNTICPTREKLRQYSVGLLSEADSEVFAGHLEACADCQATIVSLGDADDTLVGGLQMPLSSDSCLAEPQLQAAVAKAAAMPGPGPSPPEASESGSRPASGLPPALGEYQVLEELGSGGMGRVYKALHTKLDRVVAVKVLPRGRGGDRQAISRFEREMRAVGRLAHPNIVQAYDAREIDGTPVLIMEFVDGFDLAEIVRRLGPVPVAEACQLVRQTAVALQCAHEHGLVHRDIKPSNIMLTRSGELKLLDLGLARFYAEGSTGILPVSAGEEMTGTGQAMGTADYMSPEQAADSHTVDIRADLYSLGCTLYKLLSGRAPFSGPQYRSTLDKMHAHVHQPPPPIRQLAPHVPEALAAILDRLLAKDPANRFATPAEAAASLEPFCEGADLVSLVAQATTSPLSPWERVRVRAADSSGGVEVWPRPQPSTGETPVPPTAPIRRRPIVRRILIGLAFFGSLAAAFAAGVLITIKKDDQTYQVEVPAESHTAIDAGGNVTVDLSSRPEGGQPAAVNPAAELKALQGEWKLVRVEKGQASDAWKILTVDKENAPNPAEVVERLTIDQEKVRKPVFNTASERSLYYAVDPMVGPKTIDFRYRADSLAATGIYEIEGDRLTICLAEYVSSLKSEQRPKRFAVGPGSGDALFIFERDRAYEQETAIRGNWEAVSEIYDGTAPEWAAPLSSPSGFSFTPFAFIMQGNPSKELIRSVGVVRGVYALDAAAYPKTITFVASKGIGGSERAASEKQVVLGIYKLESERLTLAYRKGGPRPEEFKSEPGSGVTLLVCKRSDLEFGRLPILRKQPSDKNQPKPSQPPTRQGEGTKPEPSQPVTPKAPAGKPEDKQAPAVNPAAEVKALQGEWKVVRVEKGSAVDSWQLLTDRLSTVAVDPESLARVIIGEDWLATYDFKHATHNQFKYRIDVVASPKTIDVLGTRIAGSGKTATRTQELSALGVYEIDGDRLNLCLAKYLSSVTSEQRPRRLSVEPTSGDVLLVLKRYQPSEEEKAIRGRWWIATRINDGKLVPEDPKKPRGLSLGSHGFYLETSLPHETDRGVYLIDPSKQPKAITLLREHERTPATLKLSAAEESPGIYKLEGDRLEIAYRKGGPRPEEFKSEPGSGVTLLVLQKEPPK